MQRYFIHLAYDGTDYHGWQIQDNAHSVQEELIDKLSMLLGTRTDVVGCGRTDTGVHASSFYAHFEAETNWDLDQLVYKLNKVLSDGIAIFKIFPVGEMDHARFSARKRGYHYYIHQEKNPFLGKYSWLHTLPLDIDVMNQAAKSLIGTHDFSSFSRSGTNTKTNDCTVYEAKWEKVGDQLVFHIQANRFLRNMVRAVVGTLLEIGKGKESVDFVQQVMECKDRRKAGASVPGKALFLTSVEYEGVEL